MIRRKVYYKLRPFIPRNTQIVLRRILALFQRQIYRDVWPIIEESAQHPEGWTGWPENKKFAFILTHDIETAKGQDRVYDLMMIEKELGFRSSMNFVPERYAVSEELRHTLTRNGFEAGVHGLNHDGKLFESEQNFKKRAPKINQYLKDWNAVGFRSPAMHHNLEWIQDLDIEYDLSTFDTDPFEPQSDGTATIFPFWVKGNSGKRSYLEMPYTFPQDFTMFILLKEKNIDVWKKKLDWIAAKGGMALINTHPDYMKFDDSESGFEKYPVSHYVEFLNYVKSRYQGQYIHLLPREMVRICQVP